MLLYKECKGKECKEVVRSVVISTQYAVLGARSVDLFKIDNSTMKNNKKQLQLEKFTPLQNGIILGGLLGDMHIQKNHKALNGNGNCRLCFSHSIKQKEYLLWKHKALLDPFCKKTQSVHLDRRKDKNDKSISYVFYTERRGEFNDMHSKWYMPTALYPSFRGFSNPFTFVKTVPFDLHKTLTDPLAVAVWYLDDGTKRTDAESCRIATQSFSEEGNSIIQSCLLDNFNIRSSIESWGRDKKGNTTYQIAILSSKRSGSYDNFRDLLYPIVEAHIPSMLYKLQKPRND